MGTAARPVLCLDSSPSRPLQDDDFDLPEPHDFNLAKTMSKTTTTSDPAVVSQQCPFCLSHYTDSKEFQIHLDEEFAGTGVGENDPIDEFNEDIEEIERSVSSASEEPSHASKRKDSESRYFKEKQSQKGQKKRAKIVIQETDESTEEEDEEERNLMNIDLSPPPQRSARQAAARASNALSATSASFRQTTLNLSESIPSNRRQSLDSTTAKTTATSSSSSTNPMTPKRKRRLDLSNRFKSLDPSRTNPLPQELGVTRYDIPFQKRKWWQWSPVKNLTYLDQMSPTRKEMYLNHCVSNDPLTDVEDDRPVQSASSRSRAPLSTRNTNIPHGSQSRSKNKKSSWIQAKGGWNARRKGTSRRF